MRRGGSPKVRCAIGATIISHESSTKRGLHAVNASSLEQEFPQSSAKTQRERRSTTQRHEHATQRNMLQDILNSLPSHLNHDHPFWASKHGKRWLANNDKDEIAKKQLFNHSDYQRYDETD